MAAHCLSIMLSIKARLLARAMACQKRRETHWRPGYSLPAAFEQMASIALLVWVKPFPVMNITAWRWIVMIHSVLRAMDEAGQGFSQQEWL